MGRWSVLPGAGRDADDTPIKAAEIFDPVTGTWTTLESATVPRQYHSTALTLPDGRVWTAGSNPYCKPGLTNRELRMELFTPPNLRGGPRPVIADAPATLTPGAGTFTITTPQSATVLRASLLRSGSATHGLDTDQRCVLLEVSARGPGTVAVPKPPTKAVAPPGPYFLYLIGSDGTPSLGRPITVS